MSFLINQKKDLQWLLSSKDSIIEKFIDRSEKIINSERIDRAFDRVEKIIDNFADKTFNKIESVMDNFADTLFSGRKKE